MAKVVARKVIRGGRPTVFLVFLALGVSVASTTLAGTEFDGKDPAEFPSREAALEHSGGSEQMSSSGGSVGSTTDSRSPSLVRREQVSPGGGSVGSDADSRSPLLY